jgi:tryptophan synthase alpha chain
MANRVSTRFGELAAARRAGLITYVMSGDPDTARSLAILRGLPAAGADLIELGFPFSDPMAEGPPIQRAAGRALSAGMTLKGTLDLVAAFRVTDQTTPVILMGYMNPLLTHGLEAFARDAAQAGVDGLIVVDCPPEEAGPLADALDAAGVSLIRLATPTTDEKRLPVVLRRTSGFVYYVSVAGVTGGKEASAEAVAPTVARIKAASGLPVAVGFGIKTPERAAEVARVADACVVGSALVDAVAEAIAQNRDPVSKVLETVESLAKAVRSARVEGSIQA